MIYKYNTKVGVDIEKLEYETLVHAMKLAVKHGLFPKEASMDDYMKCWENMESFLKEFLGIE